jgi:hypothetical protein
MTMAIAINAAAMTMLLQPSGPTTIRITATAPVEVLGIAANQTTGSATPVVPQ